MHLDGLVEFGEFDLLDQLDRIGKLVRTGLNLLRRGLVLLTRLLTHNVTGTSGPDGKHTPPASQVWLETFL